MSDEDSQPPPLNDWRQGDFALGTVEIPVLGIDENEVYIGAKTVPGIVVISQSCDIVRDYVERSTVQIAALAIATEAEMAAIKARSKPRYGYLSSLVQHGLVVDFDTVATADKMLVAAHARNDGCADDDEQREFAAALARHKQRFAFPDAFQSALKPLRRWIERRATKANVAGAMLRSIEQIRVICDDWSHPSLSLEFVGLLIGDPPASDRLGWASALDDMKKTITDVYPQAILRLATWDELTAAEYARSDRLDLDGLSDA